MTCCQCEKPTAEAKVLCKKCLKLLFETAPHLMRDLDSVAGLNAALTALARAQDRRIYAQRQAYLKRKPIEWGLRRSSIRSTKLSS